MNDILQRYVKLVNDIDDYLEYRYLHADDKFTMKTEIMQMIDKMTEVMNNDRNVNSW